MNPKDLNAKIPWVPLHTNSRVAWCGWLTVWVTQLVAVVVCTKENKNKKLYYGRDREKYRQNQRHQSLKRKHTNGKTDKITRQNRCCKSKWVAWVQINKGYGVSNKAEGTECSKCRRNTYAWPRIHERSELWYLMKTAFFLESTRTLFADIQTKFLSRHGIVLLMNDEFKIIYICFSLSWICLLQWRMFWNHSTNP